MEDANPAIGTNVVRTRRAKGNVMIRKFVGSPTVRVLSGRKSPIQGWVSYRYGRRVAAPVVQATRTGANVRYLTLIVPAQGRPSADGGLPARPFGLHSAWPTEPRPADAIACREPLR